jgi:hypothetical protein
MIHSAPLRTGAAALALLLAASGSAAAQDAFTVRDSAGFRIAESVRHAWSDGEGWMVGETPTFDINTLGPNAGAYRLPDGRVAVTTRDGLIFYRPAGTRPDTTALGEDDDFIWWMGTGAGDSLLAFTRESGLYAFAPDGRVARRTQVRGLNYLFPEVVGRFADGTMLAHDGFQVYRSDPAPRRSAIRYVFLDPQGGTLGVFGDIPDRARLGEHDVPFSWRIVVATRGEDILVGDNRAFEYMVVGRDGGVRGIVRRPFTPMVVAPEDVEAWVTLGEYPLTDESSPAMRRFVEERRAVRRAVPPADTFPAYEYLLADEAGNVWALESHRPADTRPRWSVFDPEGRWLGTVRLPDGFWLQQVGPDWVLGSEDDAEGDSHVRIYPLHRAAEEQPAAR